MSDAEKRTINLIKQLFQRQTLAEETMRVLASRVKDLEAENKTLREKLDEETKHIRPLFTKFSPSTEIVFDSVSILLNYFFI